MHRNTQWVAKAEVNYSEIPKKIVGKGTSIISITFYMREKT
jgi:hypothetical protein